MKTATLPPVAFIDEPNCIGCARCLPVCPTDAILGAAKFMHTVIATDCTGCGKCLPVCPTDCIVIQPRLHEAASNRELATRWRKRIRARRLRLQRQHAAHEEKLRRRGLKQGPRFSQGNQ